MNKILTPEEAAKGIVFLIKSHAKKLPEKEKDQFYRICCDWLQGNIGKFPIEKKNPQKRREPR